MNKITEEKMREIIGKILISDTGLSSGECDAVTGTIINHPEIKSLFETKVDNVQYSPDIDAMDEVMRPAPVAEYEVIEYEITRSNEFSSYVTRCEKRDDRIWFVGGVNCENCRHFAGHEVEGESIRCAHKFNKGEG